MDVLDKKTDNDLLRSVLAEVAKANNEINCATNDLKKARSRLGFLVVLTNKLIERDEDKQK